MKGVKDIMILEGKVVIAQGEEPTAVINQSLVGATLRIKKVSTGYKSVWCSKWCAGYY